MTLEGKKIAILVADQVEDLEYFVPLMRLQEEGATVLTAAMELKPLRGKNGVPIVPDTLISALRAAELSGLIVPGGWAPDKLRRHAVVTELVRALYAAGKPIGIICHGGLVAKCATRRRAAPFQLNRGGSGSRDSQSARALSRSGRNPHR